MTRPGEGALAQRQLSPCGGPRRVAFGQFGDLTSSMVVGKKVPFEASLPLSYDGSKEWKSQVQG